MAWGRTNWQLLSSLLLLTILTSITSAQQELPSLNGQHFRITAIPEGSFLEFQSKNPETGSVLEVGGFLGNVIQTLADKANFTYEIFSPSGYGTGCSPQLWPLASANNSVQQTAYKPYDDHFQFQYNCGTNDVNELQGTVFGTDLYLGMYYISPERQLLNRFTVPFSPPFKGTPAMFGTATRIRTIDDLVQQQKEGLQPAACMLKNSATLDFVRDVFPDLQIKTYVGDYESIYESMANESCPIHIFDAPVASQFVLRQYLSSKCMANGKRIGVIGDPMDSGLNHYAIGVGKHLDPQIVDTLSYWMNILMVDGEMAALYRKRGGTGRECGYVLFPPSGNERLLSAGATTAIAVGSFVVFVVAFILWHRRRLRLQEKRYKRRFVQQLARNIDIGPGPGSIGPEKLAEEILHIGGGKGAISKEDLSAWMHDIKLDFISERDFDALWCAMDIKGKGEVDPVDFAVFLSACGPEFQKVFEDQQNMPKLERLKLAARRLSNLSEFGEDGVKRNESLLERRARKIPSAGDSGNFDVKL